MKHGSRTPSFTSKEWAIHHFGSGLDGKGMSRLTVNTGVHRGVWFFNVHDESGQSLSVQRPRRAKVVVEKGPRKKKP